MANKIFNHFSIFVDNNVLVTSSEFIAERFYFVVLRTTYKPRCTQNFHFFSIDEELIYDPFLEDFGPLNLALLYHYCVKLNLKLKSPSLLNKKIVHYTTLKPKKGVNAAYLVGAYAIIYLNMNPNEVYNKLSKKGAFRFRNFRDASSGYAFYEISLLDCLNAIHKAHKLNFFNFDDFNVNEYEYYETVINGDLNWIVPNKFLAFAGPQSKNYLNRRALEGLVRTPESYIKYFRENNVTTIIRLNNKLYDANKFTREGFSHFDLFFIDGSTPSDDLVKKFLEISENTKGAVAVHCKAGLGRTGSMIACYIMKWYRFSAREAIAWLRICRPASIIGHQQEWLETKQSEMWGLNSILIQPKHEYGIYSHNSKLLRKTKGRILETTKIMKSQKVDNISKIADKVDLMSIDNQKKDENKNQDIGSKIADRIDLMSIVNQKKNENKNQDVGKDKVPIHVKKYSCNTYSMEQGDLLNELKSKRLTRVHLYKPIRKTLNHNSVISNKRVIVVEKLNMTHSRRPLTRSKSSQNVSHKNSINENRTNVTSAPILKFTVPTALSMTLRSSNKLNSHKYSKTSEARHQLLKGASIR